MAAPIWHPTFESFAYTVETNMQWRLDNEEKIVQWLGAPSTMKSDRSLFTTTNYIARSARSGVDEDIYYGKKYMKI